MQNDFASPLLCIDWFLGKAGKRIWCHSCFTMYLKTGLTKLPGQSVSIFLRNHQRIVLNQARTSPRILFPPRNYREKSFYSPNKRILDNCGIFSINSQLSSEKKSKSTGRGCQMRKHT